MDEHGQQQPSPKEQLKAELKAEMLNDLRGVVAEARDVEHRVERFDWGKLGPVAGWLVALAAVGVVGWLAYAFLGTAAAVAEHALAAGQKLLIETVLALVASIGAVWVLAFAVRDVPWIQRRVMPGADEMERMESEFNAMLDMFQDGKLKDHEVDTAVLCSLARSLAIRNALTWVGVAIVFAATLLVMAPLA